MALSTQSELAQTLADPRARLRSYGDEPVVEDEHFEKLDKSKRDALRSIWSAGPSQFVVGPPGVGKTRLVTEVVRRALARDQTTRLLVSAQAHQALDHLAASVQRMLKEVGQAGVEGPAPFPLHRPSASATGRSAGPRRPRPRIHAAVGSPSGTAG